MTDMRGTISVITGGRGVGKSTLCAIVVDAARQRDLSVAGLLTEKDPLASGESAERDSASCESTPAGPAATRRSAGGQRHLVDLGTGERMPLGRVCTTSEQVGPAPADKRGPVDGGAAPNGGAAVDEPKAADEHGPVDERCPAPGGDTLAPGFGTALVVCRPELLEVLKAKLGELPSGRVTVVVVTGENRDHLAVELGRGVRGGIS